ncbi:unnamed protein product [Brassica oleracea var. botrytis]|uniref:(rape) hypothetical protein n=1 Tax=Brassica napus TaxID=3708 RepID=A0A816JIF2_BRANA|nr:hypothetical protein HID58_059129 [Brassica napus]CAF1818000.1 unnamed protein product [Brassica napus]
MKMAHGPNSYVGLDLDALQGGMGFSTCKNLTHQPATCRPPRLERPILAQPPTLTTVPTFRRRSETTEPPRDHRSSTLPCLPVGEFNRLKEISSAYESPEILDKQDESHHHPPLHPRYRRRRASSS